MAFGSNLRKRGRGWGWVRYPLIGPQPTRAIFVCAENGNWHHCHRRRSLVRRYTKRSLSNQGFSLLAAAFGNGLPLFLRLSVWRRRPSSPASPFSPSPIIQRRERGRQNRDASLLIAENRRYTTSDDRKSFSERGRWNNTHGRVLP